MGVSANDLGDSGDLTPIASSHPWLTFSVGFWHNNTKAMIDDFQRIV